MTAPKLSKLFSIYWIYTSLFFVSSFSLETKHTINQSVKCIISTDSSYGSGYVKILIYVNNKVKLVSTNSGFGWYKKRKIIQIDDAHTGSYWQERYKLTSNAKTREVSSYMATDMKEYAKTYKRKEGILYYTSYKIHGKEMTYRNYKKSEKKLLGGEKMITIKEHKNTSTNRKVI